MTKAVMERLLVEASLERPQTGFVSLSRQRRRLAEPALEQALLGETYVPKVPAARVVDVADALIDGRPVPVKFTGIRPSEKIHEIMVPKRSATERSSATGRFVDGF